MIQCWLIWQTSWPPSSGAFSISFSLFWHFITPMHPTILAPPSVMITLKESSPKSYSPNHSQSIWFFLLLIFFWESALWQINTCVCGWRSCRLMLRLHHKCTPHACTEHFIQPKAASASWLKVDGQLGVWPGGSGIIVVPVGLQLQPRLLIPD